MGIHPQYNLYPQVHSRITSSQGARIMMLLWLKTPNCRSTIKQSYAEAAFRLTIGTIEHYSTLKDQQQQYHKVSAIHRLSAVGLSQSLRAGNCGPHNQWLKRTVATTHSHLLDMPPHQLPAHSQILHRVSILVEAKPQNWDLAHPDDLWLPREGD